MRAGNVLVAIGDWNCCKGKVQQCVCPVLHLIMGLDLVDYMVTSVIVILVEDRVLLLHFLLTTFL